MRCIFNPHTKPAFNLAVEEWLLKDSREPVFMLWRNAPAVIVGRHQNTAAEIDQDFTRERGIAVVRRISGGGAVFHDLGNVNFSFIMPGNNGAAGLDFARFTAPILEALRGMNVDCAPDGRNDLVIAGGGKFSGNAQHVEPTGRVLHHGTLLFDSRLEDMAGALRPDPLKFMGKAVRSVPARVAMLKDHLPHLDAAAFMSLLFERMLMSLQTGGMAAGFTSSPAARQDLSGEEEAAAAALARTRYESREWNFGLSPAYGFTRRVRLGAGTFEIRLDVRRGAIRAAYIRGDFFALRPIEELEELLRGCPHEHAALAARLESVSLGGYIARLEAEEFIACLL